MLFNFLLSYISLSLLTITLLLLSMQYFCNEDFYCYSHRADNFILVVQITFQYHCYLVSSSSHSLPTFSFSVSLPFLVRQDCKFNHFIHYAVQHLSLMLYFSTFVYAYLFGRRFGHPYVSFEVQRGQPCTSNACVPFASVRVCLRTCLHWVRPRVLVSRVRSPRACVVPAVGSGRCGIAFYPLACPTSTDLWARSNF